MPVSFQIDAYGLDEFVHLARDFGQEKYGFAVTPNVDHLIRYHDDPQFRAMYGEGAFVLLDSRFLSYVFALTKQIRVPVCTGSDLTASLFAKVIKPEDRIVLIGGEARQAASLTDTYGLKDLRHFNPPMGFIRDAHAVEECLQFIESNSPFRYCLLCVGAPQQEMLANMLKIRGKARGLALCVGASVNFLTGIERRAPRWMQHLGAEWFYRVLQDPNRLAPRYFLRGPRLFGLLRDTDVVLRAPLKSEVL
ncbi:MAG TPA: WecB/TagA/CpsF family glycosyltransferase [Steroidobacteraceae bacterium]|jgi:exopolysaccharide biosynthesis WecB/TagA/CpsF family protein|nr:WecB/TagA/CpsF family glycosyltransferase [Steroidobacteraceae bacterium]